MVGLSVHYDQNTKAVYKKKALHQGFAYRFRGIIWASGVRLELLTHPTLWTKLLPVVGLSTVRESHHGLHQMLKHPASRNK